MVRAVSLSTTGVALLIKEMNKKDCKPFLSGHADIVKSVFGTIFENFFQILLLFFPPCFFQCQQDQRLLQI